VSWLPPFYLILRQSLPECPGGDFSFEFLEKVYVVENLRDHAASPLFETLRLPLEFPGPAQGQVSAPLYCPLLRSVTGLFQSSPSAASFRKRQRHEASSLPYFRAEFLSILAYAAHRYFAGDLPLLKIPPRAMPWLSPSPFRQK